MMRLDLMLVEKGIYASREKAKQAIVDGRVLVDGKVCKKPSLEVDFSQEFCGEKFEYVSRGGFKLKKALDEFGIDLKDRVVLDIGASTGGFSDVCLQEGAKKIFCVDTGVGQLAEKILYDKRVVNLEKTNFLSLEKEVFSECNFVCIDVSFVSLTKFAEKLSKDFDEIEIVALIKPQFECGIEYAKKHKGVVKDEKVRQNCIENVKRAFENVGFKTCGLTKSPILGGDGNIEFLIWLKK